MSPILTGWSLRLVLPGKPKFCLVVKNKLTLFRTEIYHLHVSLIQELKIFDVHFMFDESHGFTILKILLSAEQLVSS